MRPSCIQFRAQNQLKRYAIYSTDLYPPPQRHTVTSSNPSLTQRFMNILGWSYHSRTAQPSTLKHKPSHKPVIAHHYFCDKGIQFTRPFESKLTDFSEYFSAGKLLLLLLLYCVISRAHQGHNANVQTLSNACNYIILQ